MKILSESNNILKYPNHINRLEIGNLSAREMDALFNILYLVYMDRGDDTRQYRVSTKKFYEIINEAYKYRTTQQEQNENLIHLIKKLYQVQYTLHNEKCFLITGLFSEMYLAYEYENILYKDPTTLTREDFSPNLKIPKFNCLYFELTSFAKEILTNVYDNFTIIDIIDFFTIRSKYAKSLYRLLMQFNSTGEAYFEWEDFCRKMGMWENSERKLLSTRERIDRINKAIKELTQVTLFSQKPAFYNLKCERISHKGRGVTTKVGGGIKRINFSFIPRKQVEYLAHNNPQILQRLNADDFNAKEEVRKAFKQFLRGMSI